MGIFSSKLNIAKGKYNLNKVSENPIIKKDIIKDSKNPEMMNALFNLFDIDGAQDGVLTSYEQCRMVDVFKKLDTDGDNKLSKQEFADAAIGTKLDGETLREFFIKIMSSMNKAKRVDAKEVQQLEQKLRGITPENTDAINSSEAEIDDAAAESEVDEATDVEEQEEVTEETTSDQAETEEPEEIANENDNMPAQEDKADNSSAIASQAKSESVFEEDAPAINNQKDQAPVQQEEAAQKNKAELHDYTVQMNETFTNIIKKSLAALGNTNPSAEEIEAAKEEFRQNNPNAIKKTRNGYEYLLVGAKVKLVGDVGNKNNSKEQISAWANRYGNKTPQPERTRSTENTAGARNENAVQEDYSQVEQDSVKMNTGSKMTSEVIKDKDGNIKGIVKRNFNEQGNLIDETKLDKDGQPTEKIHNTYSKSGLLVSKTMTDGQDNVKQTIEFLYYENGKEAQRTYKDKDGNITGLVEVAYATKDAPNVVKSELLKDKDGKKIGGVVQYQNGTMNYYHYNKDGNPTEMYTKDKNGKIIKSASNEYYENGLPKRSTYKTPEGTDIYLYNQDGSYEHSIMDKDNKIVKTEYADINDKPIRKEEYEKRK